MIITKVDKLHISFSFQCWFHLFPWKIDQIQIPFMGNWKFPGSKNCDSPEYVQFLETVFTTVGNVQPCRTFENNIGRFRRQRQRLHVVHLEIPRIFTGFSSWVPIIPTRVEAKNETPRQGKVAKESTSSMVWNNNPASGTVDGRHLATSWSETNSCK